MNNLRLFNDVIFSALEGRDVISFVSFFLNSYDFFLLRVTLALWLLLRFGDRAILLVYSHGRLRPIRGLTTLRVFSLMLLLTWLLIQIALFISTTMYR